MTLAGSARRALAALALYALLPAAHANIDLVIDGVDDEVRANLLVVLSVQRYRERDDLDEMMLDRLNERLDGEVRSAMRPFGFYAPTVQSSVEHLPNGRDWKVHLKIDPGPPVILTATTVNVTGPGENDKMFRDLLANTTLKPGHRLNHAAYDRLKGDLQRTALSSGYLDARYQRNELRVDPKNLTAEAILELQTGERYRFGPTTIEQDAIDPKLAARYLRYHEGDYFDASKLLTTQFALDDTLYFSTVEIVPGARDPQTLTVPVTVRGQTGKRNKYTAAIGYGTDTRFRGTLAWEDRRINTRGHRSRVDLLGASTQQQLQARYVIPVGDPALESFSLQSSIGREELADLDTRTLQFTPSLTQIRGRWQRVLFASLERTETEAPGEPTSIDTLLVPGISYALLPASFSGAEPLVLGRGLYAELTGSTSALGSDSDFLQFKVQDEHVFDLSPRWHLLLRGQLGVTAVKDFDELPGSRRFFAGGDRSVRGFALNSLSPIDADGNKTGGRHLIVASIEFERDLPRNFGVAAFFDTGNAVNKIGDPLEYSVGVGFRWRIPVVTLGIDIAQALSEPDLSPRLHLNIQPRL
ncbi:MAG TPA: BamA/TamA family outer membrane protein [Steroidobacteraceae bacterium]|nr:BamA/TamA family outer membrane protein [Steroidobacteraceae bacterium]